MTYDAESRLLTASAGGGGAYTYDANGKRTRRTAGGQETWYIYGVGGELLAEYAADGELSAPRKEYGNRGGQILIIAESVSGGGTSPIKPASKSGADIGKKTDRAVEGNAHGPVVVDEPFADLEFNEDSGSTTTDVSGNNSTGAPIYDEVTGTAAGEYGNALSFNGVGGALLAEHPAGAAPNAPRKEYGNRRGLSIVTAQSVSVVSPTAYQSPDPGMGGSAVNSPSNTGHGNTTQSWYEPQKSCVWHSFQGVSGQIQAITLKFDWGAIVAASVENAYEGGATAYADFTISLSLDGGASWTYPAGVTASVWASEGGSESQVYTNPHWSGLTPVSISIPPNTPINQIRVRSSLVSWITGNADYQSASVGDSFFQNTKVENIRLEVVTDTTAPVISNVAAGGITPSNATITWATNENSDSQVEYGTTTSYGQSTTLNPALVTAHSQGLSGLTAETVYHYRVKSRDAAGNLAVSGDFTFTTPDTTPPVISNVAAGGITSSRATITWTTNENSDSQVEYGLTTSYGQSTTLNPTLVTAHSQSLSGLTAETVYHYRVKSRDAAGNLAVSGDFTFTTDPLVISNVAAGGITTSGATITWTTNENSDSQVEYGTTTAYGQSTALNPAPVTAHSRGLSGLTSGTLYHYRVRSRDAAGNLAVSGDFTFTTAQHGSAEIKWLVTDHLGSTRMVIDETGSLGGITRHDFLPFGEELSAGIGIRSASNGYSGDSVRQKFGSKEHDIETGFDYFIARYYSSVQGRFTSVDPGNAGAEMEYPQAWNGYSYAINNPLTYSDPDGLKVKVCDSNGNCTEISDADATKYLFNNKYQQQSGYRLDGKGGVFDTGGNKIGTYQRTSSDDLSAEANAFIFGRGGMIDQSRRAKPIVEAVGAVAALVVATPYIGLQTATLVGADLYDNGGKPSVNTAIVLASGIVPPLKSLHGPEVYESGLAKGSLEYWRKQPTEKIIESLKPGQTEPLITKPDGTIMQGNTRVKVLRERGVDVNSLPRTPK